MESMELPPCARVIDGRTVIVRLRAEREPEGSSDWLGRPTPCDCSRLREEYSGCDSALIGRCRQYRSRAAWRRYVNVSAAVCLVLLVGGLSPRASAAPHGLKTARKMERTRRGADNPSYLWENPCEYTYMNQGNQKYTSDQAQSVASQAKNALYNAESYRDEFANLTHSYQNFEKLLRKWESYEWLRNFSWLKETQQAFPPAKIYKQRVPDEYINGFMTVIDDVLPNMYKSLQMIVASLNAMEAVLAEPSLSDLQPKITTTKHSVRAVLCQLYDVLSSRNLKPESITINQEEIPDFTNSSTKYELLLLVYRDTLSYLEYVIQVFHAMSLVSG